MHNSTIKEIEAQGPGSVLEEIARRGARQILAQALEAEVAEFLEEHADKRDQNGHRMVVRNKCCLPGEISWMWTNLPGNVG